MSGFSYIIIKSQKLNSEELIKSIQIGNFEFSEEVPGQESFHSGFCSHNRIGISYYNGCTIIASWLLTGAFTSETSLQEFGTVEKRLSEIYPDILYGGFYLYDTDGGYYLAKNQTKSIIRYYVNSCICDIGELLEWEKIIDTENPSLQGSDKYYQWTIEAVNSLLGIKPYESNEFLEEVTFKVYKSTDTKYDEFAKQLRNEHLELQKKVADGKMIESKTQQPQEEIKETQAVKKPTFIKIKKEEKIGFFKKITSFLSKKNS
jgi:hypothetical protein